MWYFTWMLGLGLALAAAVINVLWLESNYAFGQRDELTTRASFEHARQQVQLDRQRRSHDEG